MERVNEESEEGERMGVKKEIYRKEEEGEWMEGMGRDNEEEGERETR